MTDDNKRNDDQDRKKLSDEDRKRLSDEELKDVAGGMVAGDLLVDATGTRKAKKKPRADTSSFGQDTDGCVF